MNGKALWAQKWPARIKQSKINNNLKALSFLQTWEFRKNTNILQELIIGTNAYIAGFHGSAYVVSIPRNKEIADRIRFATHPSNPNEWVLKEIDGLPNRRFSIFIFDESTCPNLASSYETKWNTYYSEGIPVYEKGFNVRYLYKTFSKLKNIILQIYNGGNPQPDTLPIKLNETSKEGKKEMQQLCGIITENIIEKVKQTGTDLQA